VVAPGIEQRVGVARSLASSSAAKPLPLHAVSRPAHRDLRQVRKQRTLQVRRTRSSRTAAHGDRSSRRSRGRQLTVVVALDPVDRADVEIDHHRGGRDGEPRELAVVTRPEDRNARKRRAGDLEAAAAHVVEMHRRRHRRVEVQVAREDRMSALAVRRPEHPGTAAETTPRPARLAAQRRGQLPRAPERCTRLCVRGRRLGGQPGAREEDAGSRGPQVFHQIAQHEARLDRRVAVPGVKLEERQRVGGLPGIEGKTETHHLDRRVLDAVAHALDARADAGRERLQHHARAAAAARLGRRAR
jgi:hypothetical protein